MPTIQTVKTHHNKAATTTCSVTTVKNTQQSTSSGLIEGDETSEEGFDRDGDRHYGNKRDCDSNRHDGDGIEHIGDSLGSYGSHSTPCSLRH
eukprot:4433771-Ditylum_brightwellii.AAC.1